LGRRAAHFRGCVEFAFRQSIGAIGMVNSLRLKSRRRETGGGSGRRLTTRALPEEARLFVR
jgi:hypothetical protein